MSNFIQRFFNKIRSHSPWYPLSQTPPHFFRQGEHDHEWRRASVHEANSLSPVYAAKDKYKRTIALCPLITYRTDPEGGRTRAENHPAYRILHDQPNPAQPIVTFFERLIEDYFTHGEFVAVIRWKTNNNLHGIYPIPHCAIVNVELDEEWNKTYFLRDDTGNVEPYDAADVIHIIKDSRDGIRGRSILDFAAENLGLHRQILESANAFYKNAARPSIYVNQLNPSALEARRQEQKEFNENYTGTKKSGSVPFVNNAQINAFPGLSAEESALMEAMNASVADVARWFGCSASDIGDRENSKYNSLAADQAAFFQLSLQPLLAKIQNEFNLKIFGAGSDTYCEFLTRAILQGDPSQEQTVLNGYLNSGVMTVAEVREVLNLPPMPGTDKPRLPLNMATPPEAQQPQGQPDAGQIPSQSPTV